MSDPLLRASLVTLALGSAAQAITYLDDKMGDGWDVPSISYRDFMAQVQTGDLILTSSTSITSMTRMWTHSLWSHVGMVYRDDKLYEWSAHNESESMTNSRGVVCGGPQLVPLENLVAESGTVFWRRVNMTTEQRANINDVVDRLAYKLQFSDNVEFLSYLGWPFSRIFAGYGGGMACPHVVAATYMAVGVMNLDRDISIYTPESFSDTGDAKWNVPVGLTNMVVGFDTTSLVHLPRLC
jgi:hypothetical protein